MSDYFKKIQKSARRGDSWGQYKLGAYYENLMDYNKAAEWYREAAAQGHVEAQKKLDEVSKKIMSKQNPKQCPTCGRQHDEKYNFCLSCGSRLADTGVRSESDKIKANQFGGSSCSSKRSNTNEPKRGENITVNMNLSFMEACKGKKHEIIVNRMEKCPDCNGTGAARGSAPTACPDCHGTGMVEVTQNTPFGVISSKKACSKCGERGTVNTKPCKKCGGTARVKVSKKIIIEVPAGIKDGQILRVNGQGDHGLNGGSAGDINILVSVESNPLFTENSSDELPGTSNSYDSFNHKPKTKQCPNCRAWNDKEYQFCFSCGSRLADIGSNAAAEQKQCPNCGAWNDKEYQFCFSCGSSLADTVVRNESDKIKANQVDAEEQFNLGLNYKEGRGVPQDYKKAAECLQKAAQQGHARAQCNLGICYKLGQGVTNDDKKAAEWFGKAAAQGQVNAQYNLGICYDNGQGVAQDYKKAAEWFSKAADQGYAKAQFNLGMYCANGQGVAQNHEKAAECFQKAAEQDHAKAQHSLGVCYEKGQGVPKDHKKALEWYDKAAAQGYVKAQFDLGRCYELGRGVSIDYNISVAWFRKAADQGHAEAQYFLGVCYEKGHGVSFDNKKAVECFQKAAAQGEAKAKKRLDDIRKKSESNAADKSGLNQKAAKEGEAVSLFNLPKGYRVHKNEKKL